MATRVVQLDVEVPAPATAVWDRVVHPAGINHEMRPWMTMTMPRRVRRMTVEAVPVGTPLGRAWLRVFGLVPFDHDRLTIVELDPGRRFLERSTMISMRRWEHERSLVEVPGGTRVRDRVTFQPRLPCAFVADALARVLHAFFQHRQRRLRAYFSRGGS